MIWKYENTKQICCVCSYDHTRNCLTSSFKSFVVLIISEQKGSDINLPQHNFFYLYRTGRFTDRCWTVVFLPIFAHHQRTKLTRQRPAKCHRAGFLHLAVNDGTRPVALFQFFHLMRQWQCLLPLLGAITKPIKLDELLICVRVPIVCNALQGLHEIALMLMRTQRFLVTLVATWLARVTVPRPTMTANS